MRQVEFTRFPVSHDRLMEISEDQRAFFGLLCLITSEMDTFSKSYLAFAYSDELDELANEYVKCHLITLARVFGAKCYEGIELVRLEGRYHKTRDSGLLSFVHNYKDALNGLTERREYEIAKKLRNVGSNHFPLRDARAAINEAAGDASYDFFIHDLDGNSFHPSGYGLIIVPILRRYFPELEPQEALDIWFQWNLEVQRFLKHLHASFYESFIFRKEDARLINGPRICALFPEDAVKEGMGATAALVRLK